jgi:L-arabinokinase
VIQTDPVTIDVHRSFEELRNFLKSLEVTDAKMPNKRWSGVGLGSGAGGVVGEQEETWLKSEGIECVLLDAPFLPAIVAKKKSLGNLPTILITNFSFDAIYEGMLKHPEAPSDAGWLCEKVKRMYREGADYLLRLPGAIPIPAFDIAGNDDDVPGTVLANVDFSLVSNNNQASSSITTPITSRSDRIYNLPLVVRMNRRSREEVRKSLGIPLDALVVLISFGGFAVSSTGTAVAPSMTTSRANSSGSLLLTDNIENDARNGGGVGSRTLTKALEAAAAASASSIQSQAQSHLPPPSTWTASSVLPPNWHALIATPGTSNGPLDALGPNHVTVAEPGSYVPDLINAADVVAGKCGYSTCAEVVAHGVPFVYVPRPSFVEEEGLLKNLMRPFGMAVEMVRYTSFFVQKAVKKQPKERKPIKC